MATPARAANHELATLLSRRLERRNESLAEVRPGITLARVDAPLGPVAVVYPGALCLVAQGSKTVRLGDAVHRYGEGRFLLSAMDLPAESEVVDASPSRPMLSVVLLLDVRRLATIAAELRDVLEVGKSPPPLGVYPVGPRLDDAIVRLVRAADDDTDWRFLSDGLLREVYYRLLTGPAAGALMARVRSAGALEQVARAIDFIKDHLDEPIDIDGLARTAGLSASGLHAKFKQVTTLSPMQYVKRMRLDRANTLIAAGESVTSAAYAVGYASPSQFSRDFKRRYGAPPSQLARVAAV